MTAPRTAAETRKVLVSLDLSQLGSRTADGYAIRGEWGEPDADGFYTPTFTVDYTDGLAPDRDRLAAALPDAIFGAVGLRALDIEYDRLADAILAALAEGER